MESNTIRRTPFPGTMTWQIGCFRLASNCFEMWECIARIRNGFFSSPKRNFRKLSSKHHRHPSMVREKRPRPWWRENRKAMLLPTVSQGPEAPLSLMRSSMRVSWRPMPASCPWRIRLQRQRLHPSMDEPSARGLLSR